MNFRTPRAAAAAILAAAALLVPATPAQADQIRNNQWHLRYLNVDEAHKLSQGQGVTVAVLDTGVDPHPDLRNNLLPGTDVVPGGTGDGRQDIDGHGTAMAGLIAAHGRRNDQGALGIAPESKILPVRIYTKSASTDGDKIAKGIEWAVAHGARVISISSGASSSPHLRSAVEAAMKADVVIVAAAGNNPPDFVVTFPAFIEGVLAVAATDRRGNHSAVSVTGDKVAIAAPGVDIHSTSYDGKYFRGTAGTSGATAIVAGAAALVRSKYPDLSAQEVVHRLTATATDKGPQGRDPEYGFGVVNLVAALTADVPPLQPTGGPSATPSPEPEASGTAATPAPTANSSGGGLAIGLLVLVLLAAAGAVAIVVARRRSPGNSRPPAEPRSAAEPRSG